MFYYGFKTKVIIIEKRNSLLGMRRIDRIPIARVRKLRWVRKSGGKN